MREIVDQFPLNNEFGVTLGYMRGYSKKTKTKAKQTIKSVTNIIKVLNVRYNENWDTEKR